MPRLLGTCLVASIVACLTGCAGNTAPTGDSTKLETAHWALAPGSSAIGALPSGVAFTLEIDAAAGRLSGMAGCNHYAGTFNTKENTLAVGPLILTKKHCTEPDGVMLAEQQYVAALETIQHFSVERNGLTLRGPDGTTLVYVRADPKATP